MQKILITGGSGFIGTNVMQNLIEAGYKVLNIDNVEPLNRAHQSFWKNINILDYVKFESAVVSFNPDAILHLAAVTDLNGTTLEYYKANILGTQHLIDIAAKIPDLKKVIFTSSMYVCRPGSIPKDYNTYTPHTVYGESKVQGELLVKKIEGVSYKWAIIRPTSIWGPWFNAPYIDFFDIVYQEKYFDFGKACTKTYGYVENTVFQIRKLLESEKINSLTYYLGDLPPTQISEWANEISVAMGKGHIKKIPFWLLRGAALAGDFLRNLNIKFPISSFRLSNMTTNNILPLEDIYNLSGNPPCTRLHGIQSTLKWMKEYKGYSFTV